MDIAEVLLNNSQNKITSTNSASHEDLRRLKDVQKIRDVYKMNYFSAVPYLCELKDCKFTYI